MANIKVSEMTEATSFDDGDYTMIVQANQSKKISKENIFGAIESDIDIIENSLNTLSTNILNFNTYSTEETDTGKIWIDGKPIYRKVISFDNTTLENNEDLPTNIVNLGDVIKLECLVKSTNDNSWRNIPWLYSSGTTFHSDWAGGFFLRQNGNLFFQLGTTLGNIIKMFVIIEYTKTTD